MSESESAFPLNEGIWDDIKKMKETIRIPVSETKALNILLALYEIYKMVDEDPQATKELLTGLAGIFVAASIGKADKIWEDIHVQESMKDLDQGLRKILDEK